MFIDHGDADSALKERTEVCYTSKVFGSSLNKDQNADLTFWFIRGHKFRLTAFFWVTESGRLPSPKPDATIDSETINTIVRKQELKEVAF